MYFLIRQNPYLYLSPDTKSESGHNYKLVASVELYLFTPVSLIFTKVIVALGR